MLNDAPRDAAWIAARLPHAGRMCLLDRRVEGDAERIVCEASSHRGADNPLRADGRLGAACAVEYAAQAMALHAATLHAETLNAEASAPGVERGLLVAVRELVLSVARLDDLPSPLRIVAWRLEGSAAAAAYGFEVTCASDRPVARGRATLMREPAGGATT